MAITKLLRIKETSGSSRSLHLKKNLFYICQDKKTEGGLWIGGNAGTLPEIAYRTFMRNKEFWGKESGSQAFHYMLSFPPNCGVDQALAYQITEEFCGELLGDDYYHVFAIHNDTNHPHSHITFDSVSKTDGYKFHSAKGDWKKRIQPITDRLCEKYHLPTLQYDENKRGVDYGEWRKRKEEQWNQKNSVSTNQPRYDWYDIVRDDIDEAIENSKSYEEMLSYLREQKYTVRDGRHLSLKPYGREKAVRTGRLGDGYSKEEIQARLNQELEPQREERYKTYGNRAEIRDVIFMKIHCSPGWKMSVFQRQYWERWNNTFFIRKPERRSQAWKYKKDILEVQKLSDAIRYMIDHDVRSYEDLCERKTELDEEKETWKAELEALRTKYYKKQPNPLLAKCEKLQKEYEKTGDEQIQEKKELLMRQIEAMMPYEKAAAEREAVKIKMKTYRGTIKDLKHEIKIVDDIFRLFYERYPEEEEVKRNDLDEMEKRKSQRESKPDTREGSYTRITINEKLFHDMNGAEEYITKIPFLKNSYVKLPKKDCHLYGSGQILSAYIFEDQEYCLQNASGDEIGRVLGNNLKCHYEDKTRGKKRGGK